MKFFTLKLAFFLFFIGVIYGAFIIKFQIFPYQIYIYFRTINDPPLFKEYTPKQIKDFEVNNKLLITPRNIDSVKRALNFVIFGSHFLPSSLPLEIKNIKDKNYEKMINLDHIQKFSIDLSDGFNSVGYIFKPINSNKRLILYYHGHDGDFLYGKETIAFFLKKGYHVYAFSLPLLGMNSQPVYTSKTYGKITFNSNHDYFKFTKYPLSYFVSPVIIMVNYASNYSFDSITMVGLSGGGWATTISAALDERINLSFPVAGSYPNSIRFIRPNHNYGDFEQTWPDFMRNFDYLDTYVLGSVGKNRKQVQILNVFDPCCFNGYESQLYSNLVSNAVKEFKDGQFKVYLDKENRSHSISSEVLNFISYEIDMHSSIR